MQRGVVVVALTTAVLGAAVLGPTVSARAESATVGVGSKSPGHGFEWFFEHSKPEGECAGQHVVATWYENGTRTASGQPFNPDHHTAAHRTLPFGSKVLVINPRTGKSLVVTINDRGPFTKGVTLDLARGAARALGMTETQWVCMSDAPQ